MTVSWLNRSPAPMKSTRRSLSSAEKSWKNSSSSPLSIDARSASVLVPLEYLENISWTRLEGAWIGLPLSSEGSCSWTANMAWARPIIGSWRSGWI